MLTHVGLFSKTGFDSFKSVLTDGKEQESRKKYFITLQKILPSSDGLTDDTPAKFSENKQNSENFDNETSKLQSVNLTETPRDTAGEHQGVDDTFQRF